MIELHEEGVREQKLIGKSILENTDEHVLGLLKPVGGLTLKQAINIYYRDYKKRLATCLIENYPKSFVLFPIEMDKVLDDFISQNDSKSYNLNLYGAELPEYIKNSKWMHEYPELYAITNLELCFTTLFHARPVTGLSTEKLRDLSVHEDLVLELVENLYLFNSQFPIYEWWREERVDGQKRGTSFFIYKVDKEIEVFHLTNYQYQILLSLIHGETIVDAVKNAESTRNEDRRREEIATLFNHLALKRLISGLHS